MRRLRQPRGYPPSRFLRLSFAHAINFLHLSARVSQVVHQIPVAVQCQTLVSTFIWVLLTFIKLYILFTIHSRKKHVTFATNSLLGPDEIWENLIVDPVSKLPYRLCDSYDRGGSRKTRNETLTPCWTLRWTVFYPCFSTFNGSRWVTYLKDWFVYTLGTY
jgi:hypothetical protein